MKNFVFISFFLFSTTAFAMNPNKVLTVLHAADSNTSHNGFSNEQEFYNDFYPETLHSSLCLILECCQDSCNQIKLLKRALSAPEPIIMSKED